MVKKAKTEKNGRFCIKIVQRDGLYQLEFFLQLVARAGIRGGGRVHQ